ncbi:M24 family metallopeptidase [Amphibacillus sediminis]|uniref:M24 family metallopeptidase n=1 Tax=Amphibacillus sediminis TaxID=360185 RepID=UPI0008314635|nr:Xaa-Pro aminopeptidase [Amphibacillus sediminis]
MTIKADVKKTKAPTPDNAGVLIPLTDETIEQRLGKLLNLMDQNGVTSLIIYADKEHGSNFEYLVGFIPRFEEALLVLNIDGTSTLILGNENFNKAQYSRIKAASKKCSLFSLPNQPMGGSDELEAILSEVKIDTNCLVGIAGWKLLPESNQQFDIPDFIVKALTSVVGREKLINATDLLISPKYGARITNNANEIAHYEYGASLASDAVLEAMDRLALGKSEIEIAEHLNKHGQYNSVVTICAFGARFVKGNLYPANHTLSKGDKVALTVGYRGGLSSRSGYAVESLSELEQVDKNYFAEVVVPYFNAYHFWLTNIKIGENGGDFYRKFAAYYPKEKFGWSLCPGHLTAEEEWLSSPFYEDSDATTQSGMILQVDFIPSQPNHHGVSAESTIALADGNLRQEMKQEYPELWKRIEKRKKYLSEELNIHLSEEVLPLTSTVGYYRPYLLSKECSLYISE